MDQAVIAGGLLVWSMAGAVVFCIILGNLSEYELEPRRAKVKLATVSVLCGPVAVMGVVAGVLFGYIAKLVSPAKITEWIKR